MGKAGEIGFSGSVYDTRKVFHQILALGEEQVLACLRFQLRHGSPESFRGWWAMRDSNPRPSPCKGAALPLRQPPNQNTLSKLRRLAMLDAALHFSAINVPSRRRRIFCPRHSTVFPKNAPAQITACCKSFTGASHGGAMLSRDCMNRRWRFCARTIRMSKQTTAMSGAQRVFDQTSDAISHSSGQSVALDRMLKKYGTGWQTRMVRAQRS